jgi:hypothetical protein
MPCSLRHHLLFPEDNLRILIWRIHLRIYRLHRENKLRLHQLG